MKTTAATRRKTQAVRLPKSGRSPGARVHPVIIYPFHQPPEYTDLRALYKLVGELAEDKNRYAQPITVLDRKTHYSMEGNTAFLDFRRNTVSRCSEVLDVWAVDTCQMWYAGLGAAFERGGSRDVYWLIPGDFNYGTEEGQHVLGRLHDLPEIILELHQDMCIGEVTTDHDNPKHLIDTYGTFGLLYNWFPTEGREIRQFTEQPRSEFFAVRHGFLGEALRRRWYPYEQTVVMLLHAVFCNKGISRFSVGRISDLPEGRESLASAVQQVERTERVLKALWRDQHQTEADWIERYRRLASTSEQVRHTALTVLHNLLH